MAEDLTVREFAAELRISEESVRRWLKSGRLHGYRPGGTKMGWRIPAGEVERIRRAGEGQDA